MTKFQDMICHIPNCGKNASYVHESKVTGKFYPYCADHHRNQCNINGRVEQRRAKGHEPCYYDRSAGYCIPVVLEKFSR